MEVAGLSEDALGGVVFFGDAASYFSTACVSKAFMRVCEYCAPRLFERLALRRFAVLRAHRAVAVAVAADWRVAYRRYARLERAATTRARDPATLANDLCYAFGFGRSNADVRPRFRVPTVMLADFVFTLEVTDDGRSLLVANATAPNPDDAILSLDFPVSAELAARLEATIADGIEADRHGGQEAQLDALRAKLFCVKRRTGEAALLYDSSRNSYCDMGGMRFSLSSILKSSNGPVYEHFYESSMMLKYSIESRAFSMSTSVMKRRHKPLSMRGRCMRLPDVLFLLEHSVTFD